MSAIFELWDTESANLINSYSTFAEAWESIAKAIDRGSLSWADDAILTIKMAPGEVPLLLLRGPEILKSIRPDSQTHTPFHVLNNVVEANTANQKPNFRFGGAASRGGFTYPAVDSPTLIATGD